MHLIIVLLLCCLTSLSALRINNRVLTMGITKKIIFGPAPVAKKDESRVTAFDRKVYEACSRVPKGRAIGNVLWWVLYERLICLLP